MNKPRTLLSALLAAGLVAVILSPAFYTQLCSGVFFAAVLLSVTIIHLRIRPHWSDGLELAAGLLLAALTATLVFGLHLGRIQLLCIAGFTSLSILAFRAIWSRGPEAAVARYALLGASLFVVSEYWAGNLLQLTDNAHPKVLDLYLYSFDASLHVQLSFLAGAAFAKWRLLRATGLAFYIGLPLPAAIAFSGQLRRNLARGIEAMWAFLLAGPLAVCVYNLFPALGPAHVFANYYPFYPLPTEQARQFLVEPIAVQGYVNAMPSMHLAWALLAWWYSRGLSPLARAATLVFLAFTAVATLGTGEHYFIDLIVAVPFALLIESLCSFSLPLKNEGRMRGVLWGLTGVALWVSLLRFENRVFWISPLVPWGLVVLTLASTLFAHARFQQQLDGIAGVPAPQAAANLQAQESCL